MKGTGAAVIVLLLVYNQAIVDVAALAVITTTTVRGLPVHRVPLERRRRRPRQRQRKDPDQERDANGDSILDVHDDDTLATNTTDASPYALAVSSISDLPSQSNFLATQVWPSARVAARALQQYIPTLIERWRSTRLMDPLPMTATSTATAIFPIVVCELGCGPGLPSLTAAATLAENNNHDNHKIRVVATDVDDLALHLVQAAAKEQGLDQVVSTRSYDLITASWEDDWMPNVDLWVMSDVFESASIAKGAAQLTHRILSSTTMVTTTATIVDQGEDTDTKTEDGIRVWVFAQSDRAQREVYLEELRRLSSTSSWGGSSSSSLAWSPMESYDPNNRLWLCDLDETRVDYG